MNQTFFENSLEDLLWFAGILLAGLTLKRFVSNHFSVLLYRFIKKHTSGVEVKELQTLIRKPFSLFILLVSTYIACKQIHWPVSWRLPSEENFGLRFIIWKTFQLSIIMSLTWILTRLTDFFGIVLTHRARQTSTFSDDQLVSFIKEAIKIILLTFGFFISLGVVFDVNVASLIAGLGIGGIAIALAAKETLENLIGSFTIFLDKPFTQGDIVKAGTVHGKVEKIGFRSTQIRTLDKTIVIVPNKKMIDTDVENISMRNMIKAMFNLTVRFDTPLNKIELFKAEIIQVLKLKEMVCKDPAPTIRLDKISENGIELQFLYFINTTDVNVFTEEREMIFLEILKFAQSKDIRFDTKTPEFYVKD